MLTRSRVRHLAALAISLALIAMAAWAAHVWAMRSGLAQLRTAAQLRLDVVAARMDGELGRFDYLPSLLATMPEVSALLGAPDDLALRERVSRTLRGITSTAGADNLYVLQRSGLTLAAADWDQPGTPVGTNLSFRPYVADALATGRGRFFGVGYTTGRAGYYLAYALQQDGRQQGVATVKIILDAVERDWAQLPGKVMVVDAREVVILSSATTWKLRPLTRLTPEAEANAAKTRTYGDAALRPLDWRVRSTLDDHAQQITVNGVNYLASQRKVNGNLWRIVLLDAEQPLLVAARGAALSAALACAVLLLLLLVFRQRRRAARAQQASRRELQLAHDGLEVKVLERTAELRSVQNELVHAGKMAALGQMSAGLVHELNQPLAAMRTLSDNAVSLLDKDRLQDARANLHRVVHLIERLARLTQQLKVFSHKSPVPAPSVSLRRVIQDALMMTGARQQEPSVTVDVDISPEALAVRADDARLEQVLVNLISNALDAMSQSPQRHLTIRACEANERVSIAVMDTGHGISPEVWDRLFDPFVTTKPAGKGVGLGLMISAHIVLELGGRITPRNLPAGGAEFEIDLPNATGHEHTETAQP